MKQYTNKRLNIFLNASFLTKCALAGVVNHTHTNTTAQAQAVADFLECSRRSARRWIKGESTPPKMAVKLLQNAFMGLPQSGVWYGWYFKDDRLVTATGEEIKQEELTGLWLLYNKINSRNSKIAQLKGQIHHLSKLNQGKNLDQLAEAVNLINDVLNAHRPANQSA